MSELKSLDEKIENHVPESEFENEITSSQEYQEKIVTIQGKIQRLLKRKLNSERRSEADNNEIKGTVIVKSSEKSGMNLPRLQIETFYESNFPIESLHPTALCVESLFHLVVFQVPWLFFVRFLLHPRCLLGDTTLFE
ncbi:hypothetical protein TNCT_699071 [Trichonephila clavata]|uniref:Uncharacterized protein n=1 Tax=Trichonephila clavata TaxID=2740835 RepID=A0A8X6F0F5_TRICU|nr:hypothetical protein TNCT_699071 [Trichonephila clavata]